MEEFYKKEIQIYDKCDSTKANKKMSLLVKAGHFYFP
jgi:hypothetical protein